MVLNHIEKRQKEFRKIEKQCSKLRKYKYACGSYYRRRISGELPDDMMWVEVKQPQFMGWEISVSLSPAALRRKDGLRLMSILDFLGVTKPVFIKNLQVLKVIRKNNYHYKRVEAAQFKKHHWPVSTLFTRDISGKQYYSLSDWAKKYFSRDLFYHLYKKDYPWRVTDWKYNLNYHFPMHELILKVKKSYSTHMGIPYGDKISEYDWLNKKEEQLIKTGYGNRYYNDWKYTSKWEIRSTRRQWKMLLVHLREENFSEEGEEKYKAKLKTRFF
jgi:hypothetical protein